MNVFLVLFQKYSQYGEKKKLQTAWNSPMEDKTVLKVAAYST